MPKLTINGRELEVEAGTSILQAAEQLGLEIPVFCYHPKLSVAGNCRMCLVEVEKSPKPVASCAMPVAEGMVVRTDSEMVHQARKGVLEFLLINHPLDCPICDQGGECDLQDITMNYAASSSRFKENKRAVPDKHMGPLVKTTMTRCIHCTRCVRFLTEVAGVPEMGALGRGEDMEITSYLDQSLTSELSGNIIDICPVGALTSKPYAFTVRPWDLVKTETIDVLDAVGSNIRVDSRGRDIMRILPRLNEDINEDWISDKTRFSCDGLKYQRLDRPYIRVNGKLCEASWDEALSTVARTIQAINHTEMAFLAGDLVDCESILALKRLALALGAIHLDCRQDGAFLSTAAREHYLFNTTIAGLEHADVCLLVGTNPRHEASLINARLRKRYLSGQLRVATIGPAMDLTYPTDWMGESPTVLADILAGNHPFAQVLRKAQRPVIIVGQGALARPDGQAILSVISDIVAKYRVVKPEDNWNGFNVLHTAAARVGALDLGFVPQKNGYSTQRILEAAAEGEIRFLYLLGSDELDLSRIAKNCTVVYQGHHGDRGARVADIVLPGAAFTEKHGTYVNTEGRIQRAQAAVSPPGDARVDWTIVKALAERLGKALPFENLDDLQQQLIQENDIFSTLDTVANDVREWVQIFSTTQSISDEPFENIIEDYYVTDTISRHSPTMAKCSQDMMLRLSDPQHKRQSHA